MEPDLVSTSGGKVDRVILAPMDWALVLFMISASCAVAWKGRLPVVSATERLLAGRRLTLPVMVATLVATWYGDIFGVTQIAFEKGVYMFLTQGVCWYVAYLVFALFWAGRLRRSGAFGLPDLVRRQFGPHAAKLVAVLTLVVALPLSCAVGGGVLLALITGTPLLAAIATVTILGAAFGHFGGLRAVVRSDVVQCVFMCAGVAAVAFFAVGRFGLAALSALPAGHLSCAGSGQGMVVWLLLATSFTLLNPAFCQRCLAAKNERVARCGVLIACLIWMIFDGCTLLGSLYARALLPDADSVYAYFHFGLQVLPTGLRGLFVAGALAAILSTLDSFLLVSSSILSDEFHMPTWLSALLVIGGTISLPSCFDLQAETMWLAIHGIFATSLLFPILFGHARGLSQRQFLACCFLGGSGTLFAFALGLEVRAPLVGFAASLAGMYLVPWMVKTYSSLPTANQSGAKLP